MQNVDVQILPDGVSPEMSVDLGILAAKLRKADVEGDVVEKKDPSGGKDGGLTASIAIGSLILTGIGTLVSVLNLWLSTRPKYTATLKLDDVQITIASHSPEDLEAKIQKFQSDNPDQTKYVIHIHEK